jgi:FdrA protein
MPVRSRVLPAVYRDSVVLMRVADETRRRPGVREAALFMGTPANLALLGQAGLLDGDARRARPEDLVLAVAADSGEAADAALAAAQALLVAPRRAEHDARRPRPRTLDSAARMLPEANLAAISVPGPFAALEAMRALRRGLHVFLFSDNVPLADEAALKREARRRGLFCMGPDCGTAYVGGVGLGFANVVDRGRIGCVAASGTGLQAVACHLATLGEGISQGIGVGGRDLSADVGGEMTRFALEALAEDPGTDVIVVVSKPPHPDVLGRLESTLAAVRKPVVVCALGLPARPASGTVRWVSTLGDAAGAAAAAARGGTWTSRPFDDPRRARQRLARLRSEIGPHGPGILGLFTGGTLAHEARLVLEELVGAVGGEDGGGPTPARHRVLDLGADAYTVGRPHPMIDAAGRAERIAAAGEDPGTGVILLDLVLGKGAHADPAAPVAAAVDAARRRAVSRGGGLAVVASVVGTARDPQGLEDQIVKLESAGVEVLSSNAEAARFAALLLRPELAGHLLEAAW